MVKPTFFITDVFTSKKYGGNPLATFVDCESLSDQEMQKIAKEINFSETTFIGSRQAQNGGYDVRIFTPKAEVEFAGHPTIGTAHVIRNQLLQKPVTELTLNLKFGQVPVTFSETETKTTMAWMKQFTPQFGKTLDANILAPVIGLDASDIDCDSPIEEVSTGFPHIILPVKNMAAVNRVKINKALYFDLVNEAWAKLILVFSREAYEPSHNLSVRVFADFYGVAEDAATGSGNGSLAAYLAHHQLFGSANIDVLSGQGYEMGRPSTLALRTIKHHDAIDVFVGGNVVDVAEGIWH